MLADVGVRTGFVASVHAPIDATIAMSNPAFHFLVLAIEECPPGVFDLRSDVRTRATRPIGQVRETGESLLGEEGETCWTCGSRRVKLSCVDSERVSSRAMQSIR